MTEHGNFAGKNILHITRSLAEVTKELGLSPEQADDQLQSARTTLYQVRQKRVPPHKDTNLPPGESRSTLRRRGRRAYHLLEVCNIVAMASKNENCSFLEGLIGLR